MNTAKHSNLLFLIIVALAVAANVFVTLLASFNVEIGIIPNLMISQLIIFVPGLIFYLIYNRKERFKVFGKIKITSVVLFMLFAELIIPITTAANLFSQFFTRNEVVAISGQITAVPFPVMLLIIGIIGPVSEEFVFRGIIFKGLYNYSHRIIVSIIISALFFGLMHMNLNQAMYAFVLGILFAAADFALDSLFPSIICHCIINSQNVILIYLVEGLMDMSPVKMDDLGVIGKYSERMLIKGMFVMMLVVGIAALSMAVFLLYAICINENKVQRIKLFKTKPFEKRKVLYLIGVIGIAISGTITILLEPLINIIWK